MKNPPDAKTKRPLALTIALWLLVLSAIVNILGGALLLYLSDLMQTGTITLELFGEGTEEFITTEAQALVAGAIALVVGVGELAISIGFWRQRRWAWVAAMTWQAFNLLVNLTWAFVGVPDVDVLTLVFAILLVFVLNQSDVRHAFGITRQQNDPSTIKPLRSFDVN